MNRALVAPGLKSEIIVRSPASLRINQVVLVVREGKLAVINRLLDKILHQTCWYPTRTLGPSNRGEIVETTQQESIHDLPVQFLRATNPREVLR